MTTEGTGLSELLARLPMVAAPSARSQVTLNGFLLGVDDACLVLVVGHLRLVVDRDDVLDLALLDTSAGPVTAPAVSVTVALPLTLADLSESVPEALLGASDRPFAIATRPETPPSGHPSDYRDRETAFLTARGIGPTDP